MLTTCMCWHATAAALTSAAHRPCGHTTSLLPWLAQLRLQLNNDMSAPPRLSKADKIGMIVAAAATGLGLIVWCFKCCCGGRRHSYQAKTATMPAQVELPPATSSGVEKGLCPSTSTEA